MSDAISKKADALIEQLKKAEAEGQEITMEMDRVRSYMALKSGRRREGISRAEIVKFVKETPDIVNKISGFVAGMLERLKQQIDTP